MDLKSPYNTNKKLQFQCVSQFKTKLRRRKLNRIRYENISTAHTCTILSISQLPSGTLWEEVQTSQDGLRCLNVPPALSSLLLPHHVLYISITAALTTHSQSTRLDQHCEVPPLLHVYLLHRAMRCILGLKFPGKRFLLQFLTKDESSSEEALKKILKLYSASEFNSKISNFCLVTGGYLLPIILFH